MIIPFALKQLFAFALDNAEVFLSCLSDSHQIFLENFEISLLKVAKYPFLHSLLHSLPSVWAFSASGYPLAVDVFLVSFRHNTSQ